MTDESRSVLRREEAVDQDVASITAPQSAYSGIPGWSACRGRWRVAMLRPLNKQEYAGSLLAE